MINVSRLQLLLELERRGSVLAVGQALQFSPSTVSQQLKVLEKEVGAALVERVGRGVRLTREGRILAEHAVVIFGAMEAAEAAVAAASTTASGEVRVAALQTASLALLPQTLRLLERVDPHPRMQVSRIEPGRALGALAAREFDVVLGEQYPGAPVGRPRGIQISPLLTDPLILVAPATVHGESLANVLAEPLPWVMEPPGSDARHWCLGACAQMGIEPDIQFESDDLLVQLRLVETGHAIAALPQLLLTSEQPHLRRFAFPGDPTRRVFTAYRVGSDVAPPIRAVLDALQAAVTQLDAAPPTA